MRFVALTIVTSTACAQGSRAELAQSDLGEASFEQCAACHTLDGSDGVGPTLSNVVGRKAASVEGFRYSRALRNSGITWTAASLDAFVADPQKAVPGNVMPYSGMPDARQRAAVVAYLLSRSPHVTP